MPFFLRASGWLGMCIDSALLWRDAQREWRQLKDEVKERLEAVKRWPVGVERSGRREPRGHTLHPLNVLLISGSVLPKFQRKTLNLITPHNLCLRPLIESQ